eukprot:Lithocolla_globosa_v1_NODE_50_length_7733_cov_357.538291.p2 type:complete len:537 gc:universal NODE_50_length_7733_cov_357.538291:2441-831(-)
MQKYLAIALKTDLVTCLVMGSTGVACTMHVNANTVFSTLCIDPGKEFGTYIPLGDSKKQELQNKFSMLVFAVLEEVSLFTNYLIYYLDGRLKEIKQQPLLPFGGCSLLFSGDDLQLPPVIKSYIQRKYPDVGNWFIPKQSLKTSRYSNEDASDVLSDHPLQNLKSIILTKVVRQNDINFIEALSRLRVGKPTKFDKEVFWPQCYVPSFPWDSYNYDTQVLMQTNEEILEFNDNIISGLPTETEQVIFYAKDNVTSNTISKLLVKNALDKAKLLKLSNMSFFLKLFIGARVMITNNVDTSDRIVNGLVGRITGWHKNGVMGPVVWLKPDDPKAGRNLKKKYNIKDENNASFPLFYFNRNGKRTEYVDGVYIYRSMFPLQLCFSASMHKCQGASIDRMIAIFNDRLLFHHVLYLCLSRAKSLSGLKIIGEIPWQDIKIDNNVLEFLHRMKQNQLANKFQTIEQLRTTNSTSFGFLYLDRCDKFLNLLAKNQIIRNLDYIVIATTTTTSDFEVDFGMHYNQKFELNTEIFKNTFSGFLS